MAYAKADGLRIYYEEMGEGEPALLMMPAWCVSHSGLADLPRHCSARRRVLTLDWRGHGQSDKPTGDFGAKELLEDCLAVVEASGIGEVVPVTLHHSGWVGIELRRHLGERVPAVAHLDWVVLPPPPSYMEIVRGLASPDRWQQARDQLLGIFLQNDIHNPTFTRMVKEEMTSYSGEMWMRSGREIGAGYDRWGSPLQALASLDPPVPTLHIYGQPEDPGYLAGQQEFARKNSWFQVLQVPARSPFAVFELPEAIAVAIEDHLEGSRGAR
jgi:pimeloyl-ACP methyl ester carboxylesterase